MKCSTLIGLVVFPVIAVAADTKPAAKPGPGDEMLKAWFKSEVEGIAKNCLADVKSIEDWNARREIYRRQLAEMLGLWPAPEKTDLKVTITGKLDHPQFTVEKLHFQSRPGLYVTGNLYIPKDLKGPAPAILYVCGHGNFKKDGISYGAKIPYQHWPAWFARNGYVCLIIDTLQLGEIEGIHHGTYRMGMWWWYSRGYTPAGVEAWNSIRALDYLCARPEVDKERLGVTGRSGGGAYSWWLAALDDRIKVAVPTAGITDLHNHVIDGTVEGHCDCMFMVNTYRWDYAQVAALCAPRALLLANTDKDSIFPLDGVYRIHNQVRNIYALSKSAQKNFSLLITEGPHKDTQNLQVPAFRWFNRHLKNDDGPAEMLATKFFEPEQLKVFKELPADQVNTKIQESFVPMAAPPAVPENKAAWEKMREEWMGKLKGQAFGAWPENRGPGEARRLFTETAGGVVLTGYEYSPQPDVRLVLHVMQREKPAVARRVVVNLLDEKGWNEFLTAFTPRFRKLGFSSEVDPKAPVPIDDNTVKVYVAPRGVGLTAMTSDERKRTQILRRCYLVGTTLNAMQAWDARCAIQAIRAIDELKRLPLTIEARGQMAGVALYASLFEPDISDLILCDLPRTHMDGPHFLNVLRFMDIPAAVAMAAERSKVTLIGKDPAVGDYGRAVAKKLGWQVGVETRTE